MSFGDVDFSQENYQRPFGIDQGVGNGGWPTIRYFNKGTGYGGKGYKQKNHDEELDAELGKLENMRAYVEEKSGTSHCDVVWGQDCSEMELKYISKFIGHNVPRNQVHIAQEKEKWGTELRSGRGSFAQNQQRVVMLTRILENWDNKEL